MKLYEIDNAILNLIDEETGEIKDYEAFERLLMAKEDKLEGMALWYKELCAEAKAIREEEIKLAARRKVAENKAESLKTYLTTMLSGDKFKTARVACSYRASESVEIQNESEFIAKMLESGNNEYLTIKAPEINKTAIKAALKEGKEVDGAWISKKLNIQIK